MGKAAILINGPWPSEQIFNPPITEDCLKYGENQPRGFRGEVQMLDGRQVITKDHLFKGSLSSSGVIVWNSIPVNIKNSQSLDVFVKRCTYWIKH